MTEAEILETAKQLRIGYELKRTLRYSTTRDFSVHSESVAEHVFGLIYLAQYFLPLEDPNNLLDHAKLYRIILFHDFGEIIDGDIPYHLKTKADEASEREAAKKVFASLPPSIQNAHDDWYEYEERQSPEARFAYALDKLEPLFELLDPINEQSMQRLQFTYENNMPRKLEATATFPVMRRFVEVMSDDMRKRGVFWEKPKE